MVPGVLRGHARSSGGSGPRPSGRPPVEAEASLPRLLQPYLPSDHARQVNGSYYVEQLMRAEPPPKKVMDLGCGRGDSVDMFRGLDPTVEWIGVDVGTSIEVAQRERTDARFVTYDGQALPFDDASFDLVYSRQVLEHVREPLAHLAEIKRVLRRGGVFTGSTSQFEPYHSRSYWNFTIFGFVELVTESGLEVRELRPGIDGVTLLVRSYLGRPPGFGQWFEVDSPLNEEIDVWGQSGPRTIQQVNLRKLQYAGQFVFDVRRPAR